MAQFDTFKSSTRSKPKKETIDFILKFSNAFTSMVTAKRNRMMVCKN